ncbi:MAG: hypothetical protein R2766_13290 [Saprospiraceae bacterium]
MSFLRVYGAFLTLVFFPISKPGRIARRSLFKGHTYRLSNELSKLRAPLVFYKQSFYLTFSNKKVDYNENQPVIFLRNRNQKEQWVSYLNKLGFNGETMNCFVAKEQGSCLSLLNKLLVQSANSILTLFVIPFSVFSKNRNYSTLCLELTEVTILMAYIKKSKSKKYLYFSHPMKRIQICVFMFFKSLG